MAGRGTPAPAPEGSTSARRAAVRFLRGIRTADAKGFGEAVHHIEVSLRAH